MDKTIGSVLLKVDASLQSKQGNTSSHLALLPVAIGVDPNQVNNYSKILKPDETLTLEHNTKSLITCIVCTKECSFTLTNDINFYGKVLVIPKTQSSTEIICKNSNSEDIQIDIVNF